jgi:predicted ATPase
VIPVIVACLTAPPDALVLIEEPELHLHPEAQANIADLLIESINERIREPLDSHPGGHLDRDLRNIRSEEVLKEAEARGLRVSRRFLVETHSEHVLRRMQLRVAQAIPLRLEPVESDEEGLERSVNENTRGLHGKDVGLAFVTRDRMLGVSQLNMFALTTSGDA